MHRNERSLALLRKAYKELQCTLNLHFDQRPSPLTISFQARLGQTIHSTKNNFSISHKIHDNNPTNLPDMKTFTAAAVLIATLGLSSAFPSPSSSSSFTLQRRYVAGWCGLHIVQHQKNEHNVGPNYEYDVRIYDAIQSEIGGTNGVAIPNTQSSSIVSQLSYDVTLASGILDTDPVGMAYAAETWSTSDAPQCKVGGYQGGNRKIDCGFTCN